MGNVADGHASDDIKELDTSEQITISSLALLKMLKHARAGVPMEVMGLMLGSFVDDFTIRVVDVFAMPQSGTVCFAIFVFEILFFNLFSCRRASVSKRWIQFFKHE